MFISNKEKADINEKINHNRGQIENLVKHVAKLQVDMVNTDSVHIEGVRNTNKQLLGMYWGADKKIKDVGKTLNTTKTYIDLLIKKNESLIKTIDDLTLRIDALESKKAKPLGRPKKLTISKEQVQAMKEAGVWNDPIKRIRMIDELLEEERQKKIEGIKARRKEYGQKYYQKKKAEKAAQKELL